MNLANLSLAAIVLFTSFSANAQPLPPSTGAPNYRSPTTIDRTQPTRIMVTFRIPLDPLSDDDESENPTAEKARRALYAQASKECALIVESFQDVDCKLENLQIMVQQQNNGMRQSRYLNASANYVLRAK